jgi:rhamnosyltransferase
MFTEEVAAIVVSYNPDPEVFRQLLSSLEKQCHAVIIDNGSSTECVRILEDMLVGRENTDLLLSPDNMGIARAQNIAIKRAIKNYSSISKVLLLDHDSIPSDNMVVSLIQTFRSLENNGHRVGAIGPVLYDPRDGEQLKFHKIKLFYLGKISPESIDKEQPVVEVDGLNSSGTLISTDAYRVTGGFDEDLFIDHVETDWCFRAKAAGYRLFATTATRLTHLMGDDVCYFWFFSRKRMPYRSPFRHYYIVRNSILLQKRNYIPVAWKLSNLLKLCFTYLYFGCYYSDSNAQRQQINLGIRDGMKGITGKSKHQVQEQSS